MISTPLQRNVSAQIALTRRDGHEPATRLKNDSCLLCVNMNRADAPHRANEDLKELADVRVLVVEVFVDRVVTARVRHIPRNKPLSTLGALPKGSFVRRGCSLLHL